MPCSSRAELGSSLNGGFAIPRRLGAEFGEIWRGLRVCGCACGRGKRFLVLRKPLSLCPGSPCAVLGPSVPVEPAVAHPEGCLFDMTHGPGVARVRSCGCSALVYISL